MNTSSEELAQKIIERLVAEKIVTVEEAESLRLKLSEGKMQAEDWRLAIEKAIDEGARQ